MFRVISQLDSRNVLCGTATFNRAFYNVAKNTAVVNSIVNAKFDETNGLVIRRARAIHLQRGICNNRTLFGGNSSAVSSYIIIPLASMNSWKRLICISSPAIHTYIHTYTRTTHGHLHRPACLADYSRSAGVRHVAVTHASRPNKKGHPKNGRMPPLKVRVRSWQMISSRIEEAISPGILRASEIFIELCNAYNEPGRNDSSLIRWEKRKRKKSPLNCA